MDRWGAEKVRELEEKIVTLSKRVDELEAAADEACLDCRGTGTDREEGGDGYTRDVQCYSCMGSGRVKRKKQCWSCDGSGVESFGSKVEQRCPICTGTGKINDS